VLGVPKTVGFSIPGCEPEPEPLGTENVAPSTILVIPRGQGKSITHLCRKIVLDPGGRLYQAGVGTIRRDLSYLKHLSPDDDAPLHAPRSIPDFIIQSSLTDDVIHCWAFYCGGL
jgi:hypothetical protein